MSNINDNSLIREIYHLQKGNGFTLPFIIFTIPFKIFTNAHIFLTNINPRPNRDLIVQAYGLLLHHHQIILLFLHHYDNH